MLGRRAPIEVVSGFCRYTLRSHHRYPFGINRGRARAGKAHVIHTHRLNSALGYAGHLRQSMIPLTARTHGFVSDPEMIKALLAHPSLKRLFLYSHQAGELGFSDARLTIIAQRVR
jgi:hypothetical protein